MVISRNAPFAVRYIRIFSAISFILSAGSTTLLSIIAVYAWLGGSQLRVPFVLAGVFNLISTASISIFSLWEFSVPVTVLAGGLPSFLIAMLTGALWGASIIQFRWLPEMVVVRDTKWVLTAAIAMWLLALALEVVFWTLLISLRCRRPHRQANFLEQHDDSLDISERSDKRPSYISTSKPDMSPQVSTPGSLVVLQAFDSVRNWSRPLPKPLKMTTPARGTPRGTPPMRTTVFPQAGARSKRAAPVRLGPPPTSPPAQKLPRLPLPYRLHTHNLDPSPFAPPPAPPGTPGPSGPSGSSSQPSPFLNLLNRPKIKAIPAPPPLALSLPLALREQEASNLAAFDEWDTSSISMQDRIVYSIAAAEATNEKPGEPPHARRTSQSTSSSPDPNDSNRNSATRMHRSISMPTPPRTPPELRARTGSVGSSNMASQSLHVVSPMPKSPTSPNNITLSKPYSGAANRFRNMGINIPFCDSPDREHAVLIPSQPSSSPTTIRDLGSHSRNNTPSEPSSAGNMPRSSPESAEFEDSATWQARWAATLERKVTPPMPGFEVGPLESMRRMREERERQQQQQQQQQLPQQDKGIERSSPPRQEQQGLLISNTSWIAEESDNESIILDYANDHGHSYSGPTTPTASETPSRSRISEIIDEIAEGLVGGMV